MRLVLARRDALILLGWQVCALLLTGTGYFSQRLAERNVSAPAAQSFANYLLLALIFVPTLALTRSRRRRGLPRPKPWHWLLVALADVEGNYLLVLAYRFTDLLSVSLLDAFTVPCVLLLSRCLFGVRYGARQLGAVALCLAGLAVLLASDALQRPPSSSAAETSGAAWLGDVLVLAGAALYAVSNVAQERLVQTLDAAEYLAHLGAYGAVVSAAQAALLERAQIQAAWAAADGRVAALEAGFIGCLTGLYLLAAALMRAGSTATTMNLSLLLSDFYSVLVGVGLLGSRPTGWYALAFCCVVGGLLGYHAGSRPKATADGTGSPLAEDLLPARVEEG